MIKLQKITVFLLLIVIVACIASLKMTNVDNLHEKQRSARILLLNFQSCSDIFKISKEYGEGTLTVACTNGKTYLLSALEHCNHLFTAYCWHVKELDSRTLQLKQ
jgi:hypothetical protein